MSVRQSGFTLIELSLVILIASILLLPLISLYTNYYVGKKIEDTRDNLVESSNYISKFFSATGRYPCPADPLLPMTDPNYGLEDCTPSGGMVSTPGLRTAGNNVFIGVVPITTIRNVLSAGGVEGRFSEASVKDGWDHRLTYAVTSSLTNSGTYKFYDGQIGAIDEFGTPTAGINNDAHYTIVSHGKNGAGSYTEFGIIAEACPPATTKENENCDGDATFMSALGVYEGAGTTYFDDLSNFAKSSGASLWNFVPNTGHIYNLNTKNLGVNTASPTQKVDVAGTLRATNNIKVEKICTADGTKCFDVNRISATTGMNCAGADVMTGISNGTTDCVAPVYSSPVNVDCSPNWISGVRTDGCVICSDNSIKC